MSLMGCKNIERKNDQKYRKEKIMTGQKKKKKILRLSCQFTLDSLSVNNLEDRKRRNMFLTTNVTIVQISN